MAYGTKTVGADSTDWVEVTSKVAVIQIKRRGLVRLGDSAKPDTEDRAGIDLAEGTIFTNTIAGMYVWLRCPEDRQLTSVVVTGDI